MKKQDGTRQTLGHTGVTIVKNTRVDDSNQYRLFFENANTKRNALCPVRDVLQRISDKWSMLVILALGGYGVLRFGELKKRIGDVSQRMLTVTLKHLEEEGFVVRTLYPEVPPRVEYELTELGHSLKIQISIFAQWAVENSSKIYTKK